MTTRAREDLRLNDKIKFDNKGGSILGILEGPVADFKHPTRNGRLYTESLWDHVFNDEIVKELIKNGGIPGELDHPKDRDDICSDRIAVKMSELPEKKNGEYIGKFEILDTPCGKIVYTLAKSGFRVGVSSRGNGDYDEYTGEVDPDTYEFKCFDVVILPAVKDARMSLVTESAGNETTVTKFKKLLNESLEGLDKEKQDFMKEVSNNVLKEAFEKHTCIICGKEFEGYGNNASPVADGICCDECNEKEVIPARLNKAKKSIKESDEYIDNAKIVTTLPKVGEPYGNQNDYVIRIDKKGSKDGYTIYDIVAQDKESIDKKLGDDIDVSHWGVAIKESIEDEKEIPDINVDDNTLVIDTETENSDKEKDVDCKEELDSKIKDLLVKFLDTQGLEVEGEEEKDLFVKLFHEIFPDFLGYYTAKCDDIEGSVKDNEIDTIAAKDDGADVDVALLEQLQKMSKELKSLKEELRNLQTEKAVGNSKVVKLEEELSQFKSIASSASKKALGLKGVEAENDKLKKQISSLNESLKKSNLQLANSNKEAKALKENLSKKESEFKSLNEKLDVLSKSSKASEDKYQKSIRLIEKYKKVTHEIANRYIDNKALALGVTSNEIKNRLNESYTLDEVDKVCEELQQYSLNISKLPFTFDKPGQARAKLREDVSRSPLNHISNEYDDSVDEDLLELAGIIKK